MKLIILGDTHGRSFWKLVAEKEKYDKLILIGDYWDSFDVSYIEQLHNFRELCKFKEDNPDKVVLLFGNHDFHYTPVAAIYGDKYSGYQRSHAMEIGYELQKNLHLFQMAYLHDNYLFTHAGVTDNWLKFTMGINGTDTLKMSIPVDEYINDVWKYSPSYFTFRGIDGSGDDITQSPIWVRPDSLNQDAYGDFIQVVGHTSMRRIASEPVKFLNGGSGFFIDTLGSNIPDYLVIEDGVAEPANLLGYRDSLKYPSTDFDSN